MTDSIRILLKDWHKTFNIDSGIPWPEPGTFMRTVNRWAGSQGYVSGIPFFGSSTDFNMTIIMFGDDIATHKDLTPSELGLGANVNWYGSPGKDFGEPFRAAHRWAGKNGYVSAFPNFESSGDNNGIICLKTDKVFWQDVNYNDMPYKRPTNEMGSTGSGLAAISGAFSWASNGARGYAGGYCNFETSLPMCGVIVINDITEDPTPRD